MNRTTTRRLASTSFVALLVTALVLPSTGCQSINWFAAKKDPKNPTFAQKDSKSKLFGGSEDNKFKNNKGWTDEVEFKPAKKSSMFAKDKKPEIPAEIAAKFDKDGKKQTVTDLINQGMRFERAGQLDEARRAYTDAVDRDAVNGIAHHRLAVIADMKKEYGVAEDHYQVALKQRSDDANLLSDYGFSKFLRGQPQQAELYLKRALAIRGDHEGARNNLATLWAKQNRYDDVLELFRNTATEAEAQQAIAQFFPNGRPASNRAMAAAGPRDAAGPNGNFGNAGPGRGPGFGAPPMPDSAARNGGGSMPEQMDPEMLKRMSPEQIRQVMDEARRRSIQEREQKQLGDMYAGREAAVGADPRAEGPRGMQPPPGRTAPGGNDLAWMGDGSASANSPGVAQRGNALQGGPRGGEMNQAPGAPQSGNAASPPAIAGRQPNAQPQEAMPVWMGSANAPASNRPQSGSSGMANGYAQGNMADPNAWQQDQSGWNDPAGRGTGEVNPAKYSQTSTGSRASDSQRMAAQLGMGAGAMFPVITGPPSAPPAAGQSNQAYHAPPGTMNQGNVNRGDPRHDPYGDRQEYYRGDPGYSGATGGGTSGSPNGGPGGNNPNGYPSSGPMITPQGWGNDPSAQQPPMGGGQPDRWSNDRQNQQGPAPTNGPAGWNNGPARGGATINPGPASYPNNGAASAGGAPNSGYWPTAPDSTAPASPSQNWESPGNGQAPFPGGNGRVSQYSDPRSRGYSADNNVGGNAGGISPGATPAGGVVPWSNGNGDSGVVPIRGEAPPTATRRQSAPIISPYSDSQRWPNR